MAKVKRSGQAGMWLLGVVWLLAILCLAYGTLMTLLLEYEKVLGWDWEVSAMIAGGIWAVLSFVGAALAVLLVLAYFRRLQADSAGILSDLRKILAGQTQTEAILTQISENLLLSDSIKSVAFREKDRIVLEEAIQQDMRQERWDTAAALVDELARRFGCRQEAERLRGDMTRYQRATIDEKIDATIKHIESLWLIHHYDEGQQEVDALMRLYPQSQKVQALTGQTEQRRQTHKKELLARWDKAVQNDDVDQGVELLKLLDNYLTPTEAAALQESARGVFRARLHNMGVQFSLFVTEKKWSQALKVGKTIMEEFPNSRMAEEVRSKLNILQQRAGT